MAEMITTTLQEALSLVIDHRGKTVKKMGADFSLAGHRVISAINIKDRRIDNENLRYVSSDVYEQWMKEPLRAGDVLLTSEAPLGELAYIEEDSDDCLGQRLFALRGKPDVLHGRYLFYALSFGQAREDLMSRATGTTVTGIRQSELLKVRIELPPMAEQIAIAGVLGALDNKIESNRCITATIENLVPLLFQSMTTDIELRLLPEVAKLQKGISYRSVDLEDSQTAMVTLKSYDRKGGYKSDGLKPYIGKYKPEQVLLPGDMAVAQTDLTQGAEVVGRVIRIPSQDGFATLVASLDLVIVRPLDAIDQTYLYGALLQEDFREHCRSRTSGTTVLHLGSDALPTYRIPWATSDIRKAFADEVLPLLREHDSLTKESATLERLRDALLPELLSGRLRVKDAESMMENV